MKNKNLWLYGIIAFTFIFIASSVIFRIFDVELLPSQFFGALIGVVITAIITVFLLKGQTDNEKEREKDVRIFEEKLTVFSEFSKELWQIINDDIIEAKELLHLRYVCFSKLVFFLSIDDINILADKFGKLRNPENEPHTNHHLVAEISLVLKKLINEKTESDLNTSIEKNKEYVAALTNLFTSFTPNDLTSIDEINEDQVIDGDSVNLNINSNLRFWHFNALNNIQFEVFKDNKWYLSLIEYNESWRTNLLRQVAINDVVFLFRKGGFGYVGAFKVEEKVILDTVNKKVFINEEQKELKESDDNLKYDIYKGVIDGATLVSTLVVTPIAYNYRGVGYKSVRRRTIERMNDRSSVSFLLKRFNLEEMEELNEQVRNNRINGNEKLNENISISNSLDNNYFKEVYSKFSN